MTSSFRHLISIQWLSWKDDRFPSTGMVVGGQRERKKLSLGFLCQLLPGCAGDPRQAHRADWDQLNFFGEKEEKYHTRQGFSLLVGHRRTTPADGVLFFLSICILQKLETFLLSNIRPMPPVLFWKVLLKGTQFLLSHYLGILQFCWFARRGFEAKLWVLCCPASSIVSLNSVCLQT